jgi:2-oxoisovalerate dehydrogenase E1 component
MAVSRECDRREGILFRQSKGHFQMPTAGHEAVAVIVQFLHSDDYIYPYYRDRALLLALGTPLSEIALSYFAKRESSSGGRQMPNHFSDRKRNVVSAASPTGLQCLPAAGTAWACRLAGTDAVTVCSIGDGAIRQGEFYEAWCFAVQENLPLVFVVEDNGYGISTRTHALNPLRLGTLGGQIVRLDGRIVEEIERHASSAVARARDGLGPTILWLEVDRLMSHTSSDDQRLYRTPTDIAEMATRDPLMLYQQRLLEDGILDHDALKQMAAEIAGQVELAYRKAEATEDPEPISAQEHLFSPAPLASAPPLLDSEHQWTLVSAFQQTLRDLLAQDPRVLLFGQDIEDPKGGIFGLTKGLSTAFPGRVRNAPIAEATIAGVAAGLATAGFKPVFEFQFIDFSTPALNQIANHIATLRWRTGGDWNCPIVLYAPCGGYLPSGGPWHSQTNEGWFTHMPGLRVAMPSTPGDTAAFLRAAIAGDDPVLLLLPKHLFRVATPEVQGWPTRFGEATLRRRGRDVTIVSWGNCVSLAVSAAEKLKSSGIFAEVIDLRTLVPCDWIAIRDSVSRTARLVVVQEDVATASFGQAVICEMVRRPDCWDLLAAPPQLVSRSDVHVGFNPILEQAVLPSVSAIEDAVHLTMGY